MKLRQSTPLVTKILENHPQTRDDDYLLYAYVLNSHGIPTCVHYDTLVELIKKKTIPSMDSICRVRRRVQEYTPELRGKAYKARYEKTAEAIDYAING